MECIRHWPGMDFDRWWAMSERSRAMHLAHFRLQGLRSAYIDHVREIVREKWKDKKEKPAGDPYGGFFGGLI